MSTSEREFDTRHKFDPATFADRYWTQWCEFSWHKTVNPNWTACCTRCGRSYVLCEGLFFRGTMDLVNLLCDDCYLVRKIEQVNNLPYGTCDVCLESVGTRRYPNAGNRLLCIRHAPRRGADVPEPLALPVRRQPKKRALVRKKRR